MLLTISILSAAQFTQVGHHHGSFPLMLSLSAVLTIRIDLKPDNIMVKIEDPSIFKRDAEDEFNSPLP